MSHLSRRKLITTGLAAAAGASGLAAAVRLADRYGLIPPDHGGLYGIGETLTYAAQRLLTRHSLAREFPRTQISKTPFVNGRLPQDLTYKSQQAAGFLDWQLDIEGLVANPASFTLDELRSFPSRSQITHLACEEGWSFIAEWTGVPLSHLLNVVGTLPEARYVVYLSHQRGWWDSIDMADALHPQTLVTYGMNGEDLPAGHGGPIRMRVPRQLGYKNVKFLTRLIVTDSLKDFRNGLGSGAPEAGYSWYAGI
jgi:DMSO/TMAO reductase YedYZ molybdopterin-dependent catalytic subunit